MTEQGIFANGVFNRQHARVKHARALPVETLHFGAQIARARAVLLDCMRQGSQMFTGCLRQQPYNILFYGWLCSVYLQSQIAGTDTDTTYKVPAAHLLTLPTAEKNNETCAYIQD